MEISGQQEFRQSQSFKKVFTKNLLMCVCYCFAIQRGIKAIQESTIQRYFSLLLAIKTNKCWWQISDQKRKAKKQLSRVGYSALRVKGRGMQAPPSPPACPVNLDKSQTLLGPQFQNHKIKELHGVLSDILFSSKGLWSKFSETVDRNLTTPQCLATHE